MDRKSLEHELIEKRLELRNIKLGLDAKTEKRTHLLKNVKKEIARILTQLKNV